MQQFHWTPTLRAAVAAALALTAAGASQAASQAPVAAEHGMVVSAQHLAGEVRADRLRFVKDEKPLNEPEALKEFARQQVALALKDLRRKALLTA